MGRDRKSHKRSRSVNPMLGKMEPPSDPLIGTDAQHTLEVINSNVERMFKSFTQRHQNKKNQVMEIFFAAGNGDKERLNFLLQQPDAEVGVKFQKLTSKNTPLHKAAQYGHPVCCYMLIAAGANIDAANDNGETPLHLAAMNNHVDVVEILMQHGANPNMQTFDDGSTPLHFIASFGYDQCLRRMYEAMEKRDSALVKKKRSSRQPMELRNLAQPLYLNMKNYAGKAPLHLVSEGRGALRKSNTEVGRILLEHGADVEVVDKYGFTPLHCAAYYGAYATCEMLLEFGACLNSKCKKGKRPVDVMLGEVAPDLSLGLVEKKLLSQRMEALLCVPTSTLNTNYAAVDVSAVSAPRLRASGNQRSSGSEMRLSRSVQQNLSGHASEETALVVTPNRKRSISNTSPSSSNGALALPTASDIAAESKPSPKQKRKFSRSKRQIAEAEAAAADADGDHPAAAEEPASATSPRDANAGAIVESAADIRARTPIKTLEAPQPATRHRRNSSLPQFSSSDAFFKNPEMADALASAAFASVASHTSGGKSRSRKKKMKDVKEQQRMQKEALKLLEKEDDKVAARQLKKMQHALAQEIVLKVEYHASLVPWVGTVCKHRYLSFERSMTITDALQFVLKNIPGHAETSFVSEEFCLFLPPTERRTKPVYLENDRLLSAYYVQAKETVIIQTCESREKGQDLTVVVDWNSTAKKHKKSKSWSRKNFLSRSSVMGTSTMRVKSALRMTSEPVTKESSPVRPAAVPRLKQVSSDGGGAGSSMRKTSLDGLISRLGEQISSSSLLSSASSLPGSAGPADGNDDLVVISKTQLQGIIDTAVRLALVPVENELARAHNLQLQHSNARTHPLREISNAEGKVPSDVADLWYPDTLEELMTLQDSSDNFLPDIVMMEKAKRVQALMFHYSLDAASDCSIEDAHRILIDFLLYNVVEEDAS